MTPFTPELSIVALFERYQTLRMLGASAGAIQQYDVAINAFEKYLGRRATAADLTEDTLSLFVRKSLETGLSITTCRMRCKYLLTLWRFAIRRKIIEDDGGCSYFRLPKEPRRLPRAWTESEMEQIVKSARLAPGRFMGVEAGKWWPALILVMYDTGLRLSSALAIELAHIDFTEKMLRLPAENVKNLTEQYFRLHDQTIEAILDTIPPTRKLLFPWPLTSHDAMYGRLRKILRRAGLPFTRKDLFHKFRRTCASHLARLVGESLAIQQLGHQDGRTIKRYVDPRFTANHDAALMLPRPSWQSPKEVEVKIVTPKEAKPLPKTVRKFTASELAGHGDDVFRRLLGCGCLTGENVRDLIQAMGFTYQQFADEVGIELSYVKKVTTGRAEIGGNLDSRIRAKLGLVVIRERERKGTNA